jgi:hypothetical protein
MNPRITESASRKARSVRHSLLVLRAVAVAASLTAAVAGLVGVSAPAFQHGPISHKELAIVARRTYGW